MPADRPPSAADFAYLAYLRRLLEDGVRKPDRTGTGTRALFGERLRFDLDAGGFPLLTTKRVWMRGVVVELLWFLSGATTIRPLVRQGVSIWTDWPLARYREATGEAISPDAFEQRIVEEDDFAAAWGNLGPVYGKQWRAFEGPDGAAVDQIARLVEGLRTRPHSRRHLVSAWHPAQLRGACLPPCHFAFQCWVEPTNAGPDRLHLMWQQRSVDSFLGLPFNIASYALLTHMLAQQTDLAPGTLIFSGGDCHLYHNHVRQARAQIERTPFPAPALRLGRRPSIFAYRAEDVEVVGYRHHPALPAPIAV
jgi:thymidylate synthase